MNLSVLSATYKNNKGEFEKITMKRKLPAELKDMGIVKSTIQALYDTNEVYLGIKNYDEREDRSDDRVGEG